MPERDGYANGTPSWVDLSSHDIDATARFYEGVFGWSAESAGPTEETGDYRMFKLRGRRVAGLGPHMDPNSSPAWSTYVSVDDLDRTVATAKDAGATVVVEPMDVMTAGRMCFLIDPQGAFFGLWQPGDHIGAEIVNEPDTLCWNEVATTDMDAAASFYQRVFGWDPEPYEMGEEQPPYTVFKLGEDFIGGTMGLTPDMGAAPHWRATFAVADCDASAKAVVDHGGSVLTEPVDSPVGRFAACRDPQGSDFAIMSFPEPSEAEGG